MLNLNIFSIAEETALHFLNHFQFKRSAIKAWPWYGDGCTLCNGGFRSKRHANTVGIVCV